MSNDKVNERTSKPTLVAYATEYLLNQHSDTATEVANVNGLTLIDCIDEIETAAIFSELGVADKKFSTLQWHLKVKLDGD